jgi:predicted nucleotidyltransferase
MNMDKALQHLREHLDALLAVYVFGSQVSGHADAASDLDIAVLLPGKADPLLLWRLAGDLADIVNVPVDLLDLQAASTVMQYQIVTTGQRLWARDSSAALFEVFVLSRKTDLDEARRGLFSDIQQDGLIHGR